MYRFSLPYFLTMLLLLAVEIFIGARMHDAIIRPFGGDYLCVIWLYCLVRSFVNWPVWKVAAGVLLFACAIETLQYFEWADRLGFRQPSLMRTLMGSYFTWTDIFCYTLGILTVIAMEGLIWKRL
jgi:hypothetical protein